jgi:hypothetical protein
VLRRFEYPTTANATAITSESFFDSCRNTLPTNATDGRMAANAGTRAISFE